MRYCFQEVGTYPDFVEGLKVFDKEECGKILAAELRHILLALGERLSAEEVDELLKGADDGEGLIAYEGNFLDFDYSFIPLIASTFLEKK